MTAKVPRPLAPTSTLGAPLCRRRACVSCMLTLGRGLYQPIGTRRMHASIPEVVFAPLASVVKAAKVSCRLEKRAFATSPRFCYSQTSAKIIVKYARAKQSTSLNLLGSRRLFALVLRCDSPRFPPPPRARTLSLSRIPYSSTQHYLIFHSFVHRPLVHTPSNVHHSITTTMAAFASSLRSGAIRGLSSRVAQREYIVSKSVAQGAAD